MATLPVFRLAPADVSTTGVIELSERIFPIGDDYKVAEEGGRLSLQASPFIVEMETASGGVWAADESQLFNARLEPDLPSSGEAVRLAEKLVRERDLLPKLADGMSWGSPVVAGTRMATMTGRNRTQRHLDVQVVFPVMIGDLPVVGGGGDFTLVFGDRARVIGFHGVWREVVGHFESVATPTRQLEDEYYSRFEKGTLKIEDVRSYLAYYSAPGSEHQEFLYPVQVFGAHARLGDELIPLRVSTLPATEFGPKVVLPEPEPPRPTKGRAPQNERKERDDPKRRSYATSGATTFHGGGAAVRANVASKPWEAGASWIGVSGGLSGSKKNAQGFIDQWNADGWIIDFNWGDANAWESDWRRNDDTWVDNADFVFYTGHANMNGWTLAAPDDGSLRFSELGASPGSPGDLWGQNDLEWVVVAACGPLQDELLADGGGDVLGRWDGAFDGLHQLMGYGAITFDNEDEGRKLAKYAREGQTLKNAWFRAAKEIQPATNGADAPDGPTVWVGVMWASTSGANPINDHAWSHGSVSADPTSPTTLSCMWTVC